jgi:hypothetical protein
MLRLLGITIMMAALAGCSGAKQEAAKAAPTAQPQAAGSSSNPAAKYVELVGFRVGEKGPGKLQVQFAVVNHSEADLGDLAMNVNLRTSSAKAGDAPLCSFPVKVPGLGPEELKQITVTVPTKLRVYELPDWQFLRGDFQITEPK